MAAPVSQSLSQVANARVNRVLAPQLAQQTSYGAHQNAVIRAFANSLLGRLQPIAGQVGGDYDAAIKQIGGLSANAASYLSGQNPAASQQALLSSVNAPASQQAQSQQQLGDTFNGGAGVLSFTQGVVPGSELAGNKAAAMAQARTLPAIGALAGQQSLSSALYQQGQNRQTLEAQRPGLVQGEEAAIQKTNLANAAIRQRAQAATATAHYREAQLKETTRQHEATTNLGYAKVAQTAADKAAERAATKTYHDSYLAHLQAGDSEHVAHDKAVEDAASTRNAIAQQGADTRAYSAVTSRKQANTAASRAATYATATAARTAATKAKTKTAGVSSSLVNEANKRADIFYNGVPAHQRWDTATGKYVPVPGTGQNFVPYQTARAQLLALNPGNARWAKIVTGILNARYKEGEAGRPYGTQARKAATGAVSAVGSAGARASKGLGGLF